MLDARSQAHKHAGTVRKTLKVEPDQPITITHDFDAR